MQSLFEYFEYLFLDRRTALIFFDTFDSGAFVFIVEDTVSVSVFGATVFVYKTSHFFRCVRTFVFVVGPTVSVAVFGAAFGVYGQSFRCIGTFVFVVGYTVAVTVYRTTVFIDTYSFGSVGT